MNRLEDSITLWREVCQNALLAKTTLILFLNKVRTPGASSLRLPWMAVCGASPDFPHARRFSDGSRTDLRRLPSVAALADMVGRA